MPTFPDHALVDRVTDHSHELVHQALGYLPRHRHFPLAFEFLDCGLGIGADCSGRLQLAIAIFGERALYRGHAPRADDLDRGR